MSGLFNFLKRLFSSIFGIFGGKKSDPAQESAPQVGKRSKSGYYLELDASQRQSAPAPAPAASTHAEAPAPATAVKAEAPAEDSPNGSKPATSGRQAKLAALAANAEPAKAEAKPEPAKPAAVNNALNLPQPTVTTFAPTYLTPKATASRRRPGANMNSYLDMARQVKTES